MIFWLGLSPVAGNLRLDAAEHQNTFLGARGWLPHKAGLATGSHTDHRADIRLYRKTGALRDESHLVCLHGGRSLHDIYVYISLYDVYSHF